MLGRGFTRDDDRRHEQVALLSHAFWVKHYGADPQVLGRTLRSDGGARYTIVGVMTPALDDPTLFSGIIDGIDFCVLKTDLDRNYRDRGWNSVVARLQPGVSIQQGQAALTALARRLEHDYQKTNTGRGLREKPFPTHSLDKTGGRLIWLVTALSGLVLLVACINLANLQLVRTTSRRSEFGIRLALGCTRTRLIRMLLIESFIVSIVGGALGLLVAQGSSRYLAVYWNVEMPINFRVIGFTFIVSTAAGAFFGSVPALFASRSEVNASKQQGSRGMTTDRHRHRLRQGLIVIEIAMALTLLAGAGYFVRGIQRIAHRDLGWRPENVLVGYIALDHDHYGEFQDPRGLAFGDRLKPELLRLPGVDAAALSNDDVFHASQVTFAVERHPPIGNNITAAVETPSPGYFKAYGIRLLQGRDFRDTDRPGTPNVVIISADMARTFWPGENAIGKRVGTGDPANQEWSEVVGVVNDIMHDQEWDTKRSRFALYYPWAQNSFRYLTFTLHCTVNPEGLKDEVRRVVGRIESNIALSYLETADDLMKRDLAQYTLTRRMLLQVACLGLLLAAIGIYGVIANLATERRKEVGIRMALGAQPRDVIWLFLKNGVCLAIVGAIFGIAGAFGMAAMLNHFISNFPGNDPWIVGGVTVLLMSVTLIACWLPARSAAKVDPSQALRAD